MNVVTSQIVKYYRNFFSQLKIYITIPVSCTSRFPSYVTMISYFLIINKFFANPTSSLMIKFLLKCFFITFLQYLRIRIGNCFNKFISSIFTSKNNNWLSKPIINANNFVSKTTRNVILIFFLCKNLHSFQHTLNYTQNQHKF